MLRHVNPRAAAPSTEPRQPRSSVTGNFQPITFNR